VIAPAAPAATAAGALRASFQVGDLGLCCLQLVLRVKEKPNDLDAICLPRGRRESPHCVAVVVCIRGLVFCHFLHSALGAGVQIGVRVRNGAPRVLGGFGCIFLYLYGPHCVGQFVKTLTLHL